MTNALSSESPRLVCHLTDSRDPGGAETVILLLVSALRRAQVRQHVVTMNEGWLSEELKRHDWPVTVIPTKGSLDVRWVAKFRRFILSHSVALVHTHLLDAGFYGALGALISGVPCISTEHGDVAMVAKRGSRYWFKMAATQVLARRVVAVSDQTAQSLKRRIRFGSQKVLVIPNGIDAGIFATLPPVAEARRALMIPPRARVVGTLGALTPVKDHATLLRAHALLPPDIWCIIAGEGPLREQITRLAESLGTANRVVVPGFVRNPIDLLAALDVFCLSSVSEGLPLALLEAMAAGRPVVCTSVGGVSKVLGTAEGGRLVPPQDPRALADALRDAIEGRVPRAKLPEEFTVDRMARDYLALYREIAAV